MIRIITDSAADLSCEELSRLNVTCIPLQINFGEDSYGADELESDMFWSRLTSGENPKTSQPAPDAFLSAFEEAKEAGDEVLCILLSSGLSGTVQSAAIAASMAEYDAIHIVDSLSVAIGEKLLVLHACKLRSEGALSAAQIAKELESVKPRLRLYASLDTLEYLARGGRIPKAAASLGSLVQLKPLITISSEGKVEMAGKGMGRHRAIEALINLIRAHAIDERLPVLPLYTHSTDNVDAFIKKLTAAGVRCTGQPQPVGPTISTHVGPGVYGVVFVEAE